MIGEKIDKSFKINKKILKKGLITNNNNNHKMNKIHNNHFKVEGHLEIKIDDLIETIKKRERKDKIMEEDLLIHK